MDTNSPATMCTVYVKVEPAIDKEYMCADDIEALGTYEISVPNEKDIQWRAQVALDVLHVNVAINILDDVTIRVYDPVSKRVINTTYRGSYEPYSNSERGVLVGIVDVEF